MLGCNEDECEGFEVEVVRPWMGRGRRIADGGWMAATSECWARTRRIDGVILMHEMRLVIQKYSQDEDERILRTAA